jgi:hypothetical protein
MQKALYRLEDQIFYSAALMSPCIRKRLLLLASRVLATLGDQFDLVRPKGRSSLAR